MSARGLLFFSSHTRPQTNSSPRPGGGEIRQERQGSSDSWQQQNNTRRAQKSPSPALRKSILYEGRQRQRQDDLATARPPPVLQYVPYFNQNRPIRTFLTYLPSIFFLLILCFDLFSFSEVLGAVCSRAKPGGGGRGGAEAHTHRTCRALGAGYVRSIAAANLWIERARGEGGAVRGNNTHPFEKEKGRLFLTTQSTDDSKKNMPIQVK